MVTFSEQARRSASPYAVIKEIEQITGENPKAKKGNNRTSMTIEVKSKNQAEKICELAKTEGFECNTVVHPQYNYAKGLIYIHGCDTEDIEKFGAGLKERYNVVEEQAAAFIKTKNPKGTSICCDFWLAGATMQCVHTW